jgi:hypothetical protein
LPLHPARDEHNTLHFEDYPELRPNSSPEQVIREGSFNGSSWSTTAFQEIGILIEDE